MAGRFYRLNQLLSCSANNSFQHSMENLCRSARSFEYFIEMLLTGNAEFDNSYKLALEWELRACIYYSSTQLSTTIWVTEAKNIEEINNEELSKELLGRDNALVQKEILVKLLLKRNKQLALMYVGVGSHSNKTVREIRMK